jgi:hypothetical protein
MWSDNDSKPFNTPATTGPKSGTVPDARLDRMDKPPTLIPERSTWDGRPGPAYLPHQPK